MPFNHNVKNGGIKTFLYARNDMCNIEQEKCGQHDIQMACCAKIIMQTIFIDLITCAPCILIPADTYQSRFNTNNFIFAPIFLLIFDIASARATDKKKLYIYEVVQCSDSIINSYINIKHR